MKDRVQFQSSPCEIFDEQSGTGTGASPSTTVVPYQHLSPIFQAQSFSATHAT